VFQKEFDWNKKSDCFKTGGFSGLFQRKRGCQFPRPFEKGMGRRWDWEKKVVVEVLSFQLEGVLQNV
jgi:hypothetical protein